MRGFKKSKKNTLCGHFAGAFYLSGLFVFWARTRNLNPSWSCRLQQQVLNLCTTALSIPQTIFPTSVGHCYRMAEEFNALVATYAGAPEISSYAFRDFIALEPEDLTAFVARVKFGDVGKFRRLHKDAQKKGTENVCDICTLSFSLRLYTPVRGVLIFFICICVLIPRCLPVFSLALVHLLCE